MERTIRVLIVEDLPADAGLFEHEVRRAIANCEFQSVDSREDLERSLAAFEPDLVISDFNLPQLNGLDVIRLVKERAPQAPVIIATNAINEDTAVACMKAGAADYVIKSHLKRLGQAVTRALEERHIAAAHAQAEAELRTWKRRYELFATASKKVFYECCPVENSVHRSESVRDVLGYSVDDLASNLDAWIERLHPDDRDAAVRAVKVARDAEQPFDLEYRFQHARGHYVHIRDRGYPAKDEPTGHIHYIGAMEDDTDRRRLEAQLLQAQKMEAVGRLAGGIAHDFNNSTGVVLGFAELVKEELSPLDPMRAQVDAIIQAAHRSANLTRQLLAFARKQVVKPMVLNVNESLDGTKKMLARLIGEDVRLIVNPGPALWNVKMDPVQLDQILANLATNARDAIENVGVITIRTVNVELSPEEAAAYGRVAAGQYVKLTFSDTGKGMDADTQTLIFEPFFTTKAVGQGTGLGLSTVFGIVQQNGGAITVESEVGRGTTFSILLPRATGDVAGPVEESPLKALRGTETILIVEDEEQFLELAKAALTGCGYTVLATGSCGEALTIAEQLQQRIDLLLLDVVMPEMNGRQLRDRIVDARPGLRTLFMSGYTADVVLSRGVADEDGMFIQKPFTPTQLAATVRKALDRPGPVAAKS